jgi:hypothetical protein
MKEMGRIYWCHSFGALGVSLVAIFIPIFLLKQGYSFSDVLLFLVLQQFYALLLQYPTSFMMQYVRPHLMMVLGSFFYVVLFLLLITLHEHDWPIPVLALIWSFNRTWYWTGFHYCFSLSRAHRKSGRQIAGINSIVILITTSTPAIGGIIATYIGINYVYWAAIFLLILACIPMLNLSHSPPSPRLGISKHEFLAMRRDMFANFFNGMVLMTEQSLWPIFIYLIVTSYAGIGLLSSVIAVASVMAAIHVGREEKTRGEHHYIKQGVTTYSLTSLARGLAQNTTQIFGLNLVSGLGRSLYVTPFLNRYYSNSDGGHRLAYITLMEGSFSAGAAVFLLGVLLLTLFIPIKTVLIAGFTIASLMVMGVRLIR